MSSRDHFKGKRIAVIGLGAHGEMLEDVRFLIKAGAWVSIYDLKSEARLKDHLIFLRSIGLANYVCGSIPPEDLLDMDTIILSHEYPRDSVFLRGVTAPVEYPETLFFRLAPPVTLVGVLGSSGKSTIVSMLVSLLEEVCAKYPTQKVFVIDPDSFEGALVHLKKAKSGDIVVMRITDELAAELYALRISPHVAVFTSISGIGKSLNSPFDIVAYQTYNNFIVASDEIVDASRMLKSLPRAKMLRTKTAYLPAEWGFVGRGAHDRANAALALQAGRLFKLEDDMAEKVFASWKPLKGRLEFVKKARNMSWYNDAAAAAPDAVLAALATVANDRKAVLIFGGSDSGHDYRMLYAELPKYVHTLVCIPGSGTLNQRALLREIDGVVVHSAHSIESAVTWIVEHAEKNDTVVFSPGFSSGGVDGSRQERGEKFVKAVRGL